MRKRTAHRWQLTLTMLIGVFVAVGSFWLVQLVNQSGQEQQADQFANEPDYIIDRFSLVRMTKEGKSTRSYVCLSAGHPFSSSTMRTSCGACLVSDSSRPEAPQKHQHAGGASPPASAMIRFTMFTSTRNTNRASQSTEAAFVRY